MYFCTWYWRSALKLAYGILTQQANQVFSEIEIVVKDSRLNILLTVTLNVKMPSCEMLEFVVLLFYPNKPTYYL